MATEQFFNGTADYTTEYQITAFDFIDTSDVKVSVSGSNIDSANYNVTTDKVLTFTNGNAPGAGSSNVRAFRDTNVLSPKVTFHAGSSIRAADLNRATEQVRFAVEELQTIGASGAGLALVAGDKGDITVTTGTNWSIDNEVVTTAKLQNSTSTTTGVTAAKIADGAITTAKIADSTSATTGITANKIATDAVTTAKIKDNEVTMAKLASGVLPTDITVGATQLTGTIDGARLPDPLPAVDGSGLTGILVTVANGCVYENNQTITSNYTVGPNKNALSAGPITIGNNVVVTVGSGETYTIV